MPAFPRGIFQFRKKYVFYNEVSVEITGASDPQGVFLSMVAHATYGSFLPGRYEMCEKLVYLCHENIINYIAWIQEDLFLFFRDDILGIYPIDLPLKSKLPWGKHVCVGSGITSCCIPVNPWYLLMGKQKVIQGCLIQGYENICNQKYIFNINAVFLGQLAPRVYGTVLDLRCIA